MRPDDLIHACRASHRNLIAALAQLSDDSFQTPSLLPGYSRGHVVAHLTNKANAHVWLFGGPSVGEIRQLHPDGYDPDAAATAGAARSALELRDDLVKSFGRLEAAWDALDDLLWDRQATMTAGPRTMAETVAHHLRNVAVHHVDLDIGYVASDWPRQFVEEELARRLRALPDRADHAELLAWLLARGPAPELESW